MGMYAGVGQAKTIDEGRQIEVWADESVNATLTPVQAMSTAVRFVRTRGVYYPLGFSVQVAFGAAPGAFEVDVLSADTDDPACYVKIGSITTVNTSNVGRAEFPNSFCRFVALRLASLTNNATIQGLITR